MNDHTNQQSNGGLPVVRAMDSSCGTASMDLVGAADPDSSPTAPHLDLADELARGSMGRIHFAEDRKLLRQVAVKRLDRELASVSLHRDSFLAEARITGQLDHPNVVPVHDVGVMDDGIPYFTMNVVRGSTFAEWLGDPAHEVGTAVRLEEGIEILLKVCDAVAYAHSRGVIHRDLKPENVMVAEFGQVYLIDWGLARLRDTDSPDGQPSCMNVMGVVGTPTHMAPEQARGNPFEMDERSDVFGLGAILYEVLSGRSPYGASKDVNVLVSRAWGGEVIPIDEALVGIAVPRRIRVIVEKAVAADPAERYQSVVELQRDLRAFLRGGFHLRQEVFSAGEVICAVGEVGDAAYLIVEGRCRAFRMVGGCKETLATMQAGDVFGATSTLFDEARAASVEAVDQVTVRVLDRSTFATMFDRESWSGAVTRALARRCGDLELVMRQAGDGCMREGTHATRSSVSSRWRLRSIWQSWRWPFRIHQWS